MSLFMEKEHQWAAKEAQWSAKEMRWMESEREWQQRADDWGLTRKALTKAKRDVQERYIRKKRVWEDTKQAWEEELRALQEQNRMLMLQTATADALTMHSDSRDQTVDLGDELEWLPSKEAMEEGILRAAELSRKRAGSGYDF